MSLFIGVVSKLFNGGFSLMLSGLCVPNFVKIASLA